nr:MAG TPA: hypothetical protein [Caudoviricetes sp.]
MTKFEHIKNMTVGEFVTDFVDFMAEYEPYIAHNREQSIKDGIRYLESEWEENVNNSGNRKK